MFLAKVVWNTKVIGKLPATGPVLFAPNHTGVVDGPIVHGAVKRPNHIMVKAEAFEGFFAPILRASGQIHTDRLASRGALRAALGVLERGGVVGVFPEGYRGQGRATDVRSGISWLAMQSGAPVVPVAVLGTRPTGKSVGYIPPLRAKLIVDIGEPFMVDVPDGMPGRQARQLATEQIQHRLANHIQRSCDSHGIALPDDGPTGIGQV